MPSEAKTYIQAIEKFIESKNFSISTSPERKDTMRVEDPLNNYLEGRRFFDLLE